MIFYLWLLTGLFFTREVSGLPTSVPEHIRNRYAYLYDLPVVELGPQTYSFHKGRLFLRNGLRILSLKGDAFEMAFQHGRLLKADIQKGALYPAALMLENSARNTLPNMPLTANQIIKLLYKKYPRAIVDNSLKASGLEPNLVFQEAYAMSDAAQMPLLTLFDAVTGPEALQVILGERYGKQWVPVAPSPACTAFVAWGSFTQGGEMIIGRNTDYPLNGYFDRFPTVLYYAPKTGQRYMTVTSAGLHNVGVVGYNESGLYLGVHTVPTADVSPSGPPVFLTAQEVLRKARSFDEAVKLFSDSARPAAGWTYLLVSTKEKRAASLEFSRNGFAVLPMQGEYHIQTNHYRSEKMIPKYLHVNQSIDEDTFAREKRVGELIESLKPINEKTAISILADKLDPISGQIRGIGNVVAVHTTLTSVVVKPEQGKILVANGTAPVSRSQYVSLPLVEDFDVESFGNLSLEQVESHSVDQVPETIVNAEQQFILGKVAYEDELNYKKAITHMRRAASLEPENPSYPFVLAVLLMKSGNFNGALAPLKAVIKLNYEHPRWLSHYYLARIYAQQGERGSAIRELEFILEKADPKIEAKLLSSVRKSLATLKGGRRLRLQPHKLVLYIQQADLVDYD